MIWSPLLLLLSSQETLFLELCGRTREENHQGIARSKVAWCLQSPPTWEMWSLSRPLDYCHRATTRTGATKTGSTVHLPWALDSSTTCERTLCKNQDMLRNVPKCWAKTQSNCFKECFGRNIFETFLESFNKFGFSSVHLWGGGTHCWISSKPWVLLGLVTSTNHQQSDLGPLTPLLGKLILNWIILLVFSRILELIFPIFMHHWIFYCQWLRQ